MEKVLFGHDSNNDLSGYQILARSPSAAPVSNSLIHKFVGEIKLRAHDLEHHVAWQWRPLAELVGLARINVRRSAQGKRTLEYRLLFLSAQEACERNYEPIGLTEILEADDQWTPPLLIHDGEVRQSTQTIKAESPFFSQSLPLELSWPPHCLSVKHLLAEIIAAVPLKMRQFLDFRAPVPTPDKGLILLVRLTSAQDVWLKRRAQKVKATHPNLWPVPAAPFQMGLLFLIFAIVAGYLWFELCATKLKADLFERRQNDLAYENAQLRSEIDEQKQRAERHFRLYQESITSLKRIDAIQSRETNNQDVSTAAPSGQPSPEDLQRKIIAAWNDLKASVDERQSLSPEERSNGATMLENLKDTVRRWEAAQETGMISIEVINEVNRYILELEKIFNSQ